LVGRVQRGDLDSTVFGLLYNMMQDEAIVCILVGTRRLPELGKTSRSTDKVVEWVDQIIEMVTFQRIGLLPPDLACRLIEEPVEHSRMRYQAAAIQAILSATGGYPYLIQLLCGKLVSRRNEQRQNEMTVDDVQFAIEALLETTQPGFFWKRLTPHQQIVLIAACQLWQDQQIVTAHDVEAQLQTLEVPWQNWKTPVRSLLRELALEELLQGKGKGRHFEYRLTFELLSAWVRRHKTLDQIREEMDHDA